MPVHLIIVELQAFQCLLFCIVLFDVAFLHETIHRRYEKYVFQSVLSQSVFTGSLEKIYVY